MNMENDIRIKMCGMTRQKDVVLAAEIGVNAVGFVFHPPSPRAITAEKAGTIVRALPPGVLAVGVFVNAARSWVEEAVEISGVSAIQFCGDETPEDCAGYRLPLIKSFRLSPDFDPSHWERYPNSMMLLDAWHPTLYGGTGIPVGAPPAWRARLERPFWLAGGLTPETVRAVIRAWRPLGVDVAGGVEEKPGIKDRRKMVEFVQQVRSPS